MRFKSFAEALVYSIGKAQLRTDQAVRRYAALDKAITDNDQTTLTADYEIYDEAQAQAQLENLKREWDTERAWLRVLKDTFDANLEYHK